MDVTYVVTQTESAVLGRTQGSTVTADELVSAGCDIDALIFGGHIAPRPSAIGEAGAEPTPAKKPKSTPATSTTTEQE